MFKKSLALVLSLMLFAGAFAVGVSAQGDVDYTIINPYEDVDWATYQQYRAALHNHSNVSDGDNEFYQMVEKYYEVGYDILAMTDHGTVDRSWVDVNYVPAIRALLTQSLSAPTGLTQARYEEIASGAGRDGQIMLRVPFGIELNAASPNNTHINSWFADYGNGMLGAASDYETGLKGVQAAGGLCVINHPGEYTNQRDVYDPNKAYTGGLDNYYVKKFANLLVQYPACLGIDINSKSDTRTKNDRILWDYLLMSVIPEGRNVYAVSTSDAHRFNVVGCGWTVMLMPENTTEALRASMESGNFFAASMYNKNKNELKFLKEQLGDEFNYTIDGQEWEWVAENTVDADGTPIPDNAAPVVTNITTGDNKIAIEAENEKLIYWVADGKIIATGNEIDLNDYSDQIGSYVRAEIFGDGGILYSQAFMLEYEGAPGSVLDPVIDGGSIFGKIWHAIWNFFFNHPIFSKLREWATGNK